MPTFDDVREATRAIRDEARRVAASEAILHVTRVPDGSAVMHRSLQGRSWLIGRSPDAHIHLDDDAVSRHHAELKRCPFGRWWIHDLGSTNGTLVNGRRVRSCMLSRGDQVVVGGFNLLLDLPDGDGLVRHDSDVPPPEEPHTMPRRSNGMQVIPAREAQADVRAAHLNAVTALGSSLLRIDDASARRQELCELMVSRFGAHGSLVLRLYENGRLRLLNGPCGGNGKSTRPPAVSEQVLRELWDHKIPIVAHLAESGPHLVRATKPGLISAAGVLACPIAHAKGHIDALYISLTETKVSEEWRSLLKLIASTYEQAEVVWEMRQQVRASAFVEHELETARNVQHRLMPLDAHFDELELVMGYEPCLWVGGDYVDAVTLSSDRVLLVIADVCGKGMQGALVTSSLHTLVRATVEGGEELPRLVSRMNRYLSRHLPEDSFVTLAAVALDPHTGLIECINAGHLPVLIARPDGDVRALQSASNLALGMLEEVPFVPEYSQLGEDEVLLMYTDGLVELMDADRQPLGPERFREGVGRTVAHSNGTAVKALDKVLRSMIEDHRRAQLPTDDAAFLIARRMPAAEPAAIRWPSDELCRQTIH